MIWDFFSHTFMVYRASFLLMYLYSAHFVNYSAAEKYFNFYSMFFMESKSQTHSNSSIYLFPAFIFTNGKHNQHTVPSSFYFPHNPVKWVGLEE